HPEAPAQDPARRVPAHRQQAAGGAADAGDTGADTHPEALPPAVDEPALHAPGRADAGSGRSLRAAGGRRHPARQPDGAAQGRQRRSRDHEAPGARPAAHPREAVLPVPVRPDLGLGALPHPGLERRRADPRPARPHDGLRRPDVRRGRPEGRRQDPGFAGLRRRLRRRRPPALELRRQHLPLPRSGAVAGAAGGRGGAVMKRPVLKQGTVKRTAMKRTAMKSTVMKRPLPKRAPLRVGITYDLRDAWLAAGYSELDTAEFDRADTIDAIAHALETLGYAVDRIGHVQQLAAQLV